MINMCFHFECDVETFEAKICCHAKDNQNTGCRLPCMSNAILRNVVVTIGSMYLIVSLLPVSYYIAIHDGAWGPYANGPPTQDIADELSPPILFGSNLPNFQRAIGSRVKRM